MCLLDDLLPNKPLRDTIKRIFESSNGNGGSAYRVQDMESSKCAPLPQPKIPSHAPSAASSGEQQSLPQVEGITKMQPVPVEHDAALVIQQTTLENGKLNKAPDI